MTTPHTPDTFPTDTSLASGRRRGAGLGPTTAFVLYAVSAALVMFGLLAAATPFVVMIPVGIALGGFAFIRRHGAPDVIGLVTGGSAIPLFLSWTHPGNRFPFIMGGLIVVCFGVGLHLLRRKFIASRIGRSAGPTTQPPIGEISH